MLEKMDLVDGARGRGHAESYQPSVESLPGSRRESSRDITVVNVGSGGSWRAGSRRWRRLQAGRTTTASFRSSEAPPA